MARDVTGLASDIEALINNMLSPAYQDPAQRATAISKYSLDLATAIDVYISKILTSVDSESLV